MSYSKRTSPRRSHANGGIQADVLANQAEALLRELKSATPSSPAYYAPVSVSPVALLHTPETRPPPLRSTLTSQFRHVSPSRSHAREVVVIPTPDPMRSRKVVEEKLNLPLVEAQGKIEQLLLQLDVSMETQKTLSMRLEEARRQAQDAMMKAADAHELRAENEVLKHQLATKSIEGEALDALKADRDALARRVAELEAEVAQLLERQQKTEADGAKRLADEKAALQAEHEAAYLQLQEEKAAVDAELQGMKDASAGIHDNCARELEKQHELRREAEQDIERLTGMLKEAAGEADAKDRQLGELNDTLSGLQKELDLYREKHANGDSALQDLIEQLRTREASLTAKDGELAAKNNELADKDRELSEKSMELAEKDRQLADKDRQLGEDTANREKELAQQIAEQLAKKNRDLVDMLAEAEQELASERDARLRALGAKDSESGEIIAKLQSELAAAENKLKQQKYELEAAQLRLNDSASSAQTAFDAEITITELTRALEMAKQGMQGEQAKAARVASERAQLEQELADLKAECQSLRNSSSAELQGLKQRELDLAAAADKAAHRVKLLEAEVKRLTDAVASAERRSKDEQETAASLRDSLQAQITALQRSKIAGIEETDGLVSDLTNQLSQAKLAKQKCEAEKEDLRMKYERQLQEAKSAMSNAAHEHSMAMQGQANERARALQKLRDELTTVHAQEVDALKLRHGRELAAARSGAQQQCEEKLHEMDKNVRQLEAELGAKDITIASLEAKVQRLQRQIEAAEQERMTTHCESISSGTMTEVITKGCEVQTEDVRRVAQGTQAELRDERVEMELKLHREAVERAKKLAAQESLARNKQMEELETIKRAAVQEAFAKGQALRELQEEREHLLREIEAREERIQALLEEVGGLRMVGGKHSALKAETEGIQVQLQEALEQLLMKKKEIERLEAELQGCQAAVSAKQTMTAATPFTPTPSTPVSSALLSRPPPGRPQSQPLALPPTTACYPSYPPQHVEVEIISETQPCTTAACHPRY